MKITEKLKIALKRMLSLELGRVVTDKAELIFDGELAEGIEVFVEDENGDAQPAADGEYTAENCDVIVVAEGKVAEIRKKEEEPAEEVAEEVAADEIEEPAADPADATDDVQEERIEDRVERLEGIVNGFAEGVEKILNAMAALEARVEELEAKVSALDSEPAAEPADEVEAEEEKPKNRLAYLRKN